MKRVLLLIPEGLTFDLLTEEQQERISAIFGQYVMPMPSSIAVDKTVICDAICDDSFDPTAMGALGLKWGIIGMWQWDGKADKVTELVAIDKDKYLERLAPNVVYNEEDETFTETPATFREVHTWAGFPVCF